MIHEYLNRRVVGKIDRLLMLPDDYQAYRMSREEGMRFFMNALNPLCISGFDGRFMHVNPKWEALLGYPLAKIRGVHRLNFVHPEDHEQTIAAERRLLSGESLRGFENRYRCRNGEIKWLCWDSVPDMDRREVVSIVREVTREKQDQADREYLIRLFKRALREMKVLGGLLPVCSNCKKIRDDRNRWHAMESYIEEHTEASFTHGVCPECIKALYPDYQDAVDSECL